MLLILSFLIASITLFNSPNNQYNFNAYSEEFLKQTKFSKSITIDIYGFMWIISDNKLIRFDGNHYNSFDNTNLDYFFSNEIQSMKVYGNYIYLLSREEGLIKFNVQTFETDHIIYEGVSDIDYVDKEDKLYVLMSDGYLSEFQDRKLIRKIKVAINFGLIKNVDDKLFLALQNQGIYLIDRTTFEITNLTELYNYPVPTGWKEQFLVSKDGDLIYNSHYNAYIVNTDSYSNFTVLTLCPSNEPYLLLDERGVTKTEEPFALYFCNQSLFTYDIDQNNFSRVKSTGLPRTAVPAFFFSVNTDDIFVSTNQGVYRATSNSKYLYSLSDDHLHNRSGPRIRRSIVEFDDQIYLFGFPGLLKINRDYELEIVNQENNYLYFDAIRVENYMYATTEGAGILKLNKDARVINQFEGNSDFDKHHYSIKEYNKEQLMAGGRGIITIVI